MILPVLILGTTSTFADVGFSGSEVRAVISGNVFLEHAIDTIINKMHRVTTFFILNQISLADLLRNKNEEQPVSLFPFQFDYFPKGRQ